MPVSNAKLPPEYSLDILLPERVEQEFRQWVERTPGATRPPRGGHITLLNRFVSVGRLKLLVERIEEACVTFRPFTITLNEVVCDQHWSDPQLKTVLLINSSRDTEDYRTLVQLHDRLNACLGSLKRDAQPEISKRDYVPHLSLTRGSREAEAIRLTEAARAARLTIAFTAERIWLLEFTRTSSETEQMRRVRSFALGG